MSDSLFSIALRTFGVYPSTQLAHNDGLGDFVVLERFTGGMDTVTLNRTGLPDDGSSLEPHLILGVQLIVLI